MSKQTKGPAELAFLEAVEAEEKNCKGDRARAVQRVVAAHPELHAAYVEEINLRKGK